MISRTGDDKTMFEELREQFTDHFEAVDPRGWDNIYVVGDVHGCTEEFREMIELIGLTDSELLVCVGDVIRKGPDSAGAVEIVQSNPNILSVWGNGEFKYLRGEETVEDLNEDHRAFIDTWPVIIAWPDNLVVHGGFNPNKPLSDHTVEDVVNMRSPRNNNNYDTPFWFESFTRSTRIFFGHTVTNQPIVQKNAVALDTGCVYGGELTAFDTHNDQLYSVPAKQVYVPREDHKYADTQRRCAGDNRA